MSGLEAESFLQAGHGRFKYWSLERAEARGLAPASRLPRCLRVLLENVLRRSGSEPDPGRSGSDPDLRDLRSLSAWLERRSSDEEVGFYPARVLMPDSSGVPLLADLAAMRDAVRRRGGDPSRVNPLVPVDLVIDHSVAVDHAGRPEAYDLNLRLEHRRNRERYAFLKWAQRSFRNFRVVPPGRGIVHQVNLEHLARVVWTEDAGAGPLAYPDTLVGMDSHTPMINALGVLGWGVGGIEAGAAMLGEPVSMRVPEVVGCRLRGAIRPGVTCTDVVLSLTEALRRVGVVGRFVEFFGEGLDGLPLAHRATLANMTPEMGATVSFFPVDDETLRYLRLTGRAEGQVALVEAYCKAQGLWRSDDEAGIAYTRVVEFDLSAVEPCLAGPSRPQDRVPLGGVPGRFHKHFPRREPPEGRLNDGDVVIAAITSCTNTSNPEAMIGAGLLARNLRARGLQTKPWVKASLSPGSRVVTDYLREAGLQEDLDALGFHLTGYGCMTCAGASGPLDEAIAREIEENSLAACAVLSSNRNFEGRTHPLVRAGFLASPALVVAYAVAGSVLKDLSTEPLGLDPQGREVRLADVWPPDAEVQDTLRKLLRPELFARSYADVFEGDEHWKAIPTAEGDTFAWDPASTYIRPPPFLDLKKAASIEEARALLVLGEGITTDHISPVGSISPDSPAAAWLREHGVAPGDFNSFLSRRANHEVMVRGTFWNPRLKNELAPGREGGFTRRLPDGPLQAVYEAAMDYAREGIPLVIVAGAEYGTGSSRDWAAKGTRLLGVAAVIAESIERIHRSNLVMMGVLPLQFPPGVTRTTLGLTGDETYSIRLDGRLAPRQTVDCEVRSNGRAITVPLTSRLDIPQEVAWFRSGGILPYVLGRLAPGGD